MRLDSVKIRSQSRWCLSPILSKFHSWCLTRDLEGLRDFEIGQANCTVIPAYDLLLQAEEETALEGATDRITEIGGCSGMEPNGGKVRFDNPNTNVRKAVYDRSKTTEESETFLTIWVTQFKMYTWNVTKNCQ